MLAREDYANALLVFIYFAYSILCLLLAAIWVSKSRVGKVDLVRKLWVGMAWAAKPCTALRLG